MGKCRGPKRLASLIWLVFEHFDLLEVDFHTYYNIDITGVFTGDLSFRKLLVLAHGLQRGSSFLAAIHEQPRRSFADEILMDIVESNTGKPHPVRDYERKVKEQAERAPIIEAAKRRAAEQRAKSNGDMSMWQPR